MDYIKITVNIQDAKEWFTDVLISEMGNIGFESFEETDAGLEAYISIKEYDEKKLTELFSSQPANEIINWNKEVIKDQNWNEEWEKNYFNPLVVAEECLVRAPFHKDYPQCRYEIVIEPNMAFGTGNHETTSMMLEAILKEDIAGKDVLDMGCGTGILGILASMKGAKKVLAIDIDEWPVKGTLENANLNNVDNIIVKQGDAALLGNERFDVILANIHKNVLIQDLPKYAAVLNKNGKLFMSGFYKEDLDPITTAALSTGLRAAGHQEKNRWIMAAFHN
ncbi:MAG TPA: 50S ribosomal protein L11 methyltransferase [Mariniphaga sp.]|nr:50S ribosomal protein L11 methyltransferase [Mariniphaga sp.]